MTPLSIIIPTLNEETYLPRLLESLLISSNINEVEVIVVDGGSSDRTLMVAKAFKKRIPNLVVYETKKGTSIQRNYGASKAKYETLVFLDADMELSAGSLEKIANRVKNVANFIAIPFIYPYDGKYTDLALSAITYAYFYLMLRRSPVISGMCIITTQAVHDKINGFDEKILHAEDIDYGLRAAANGVKHHIFLNVRIKTSARRADIDGRIKTAMTWLRWHKDAREDRKRLYSNGNKEYKFGEFKKH